MKKIFLNQENPIYMVLLDDEERIIKSLEREIRLHFQDAPFTIKSFTNPFDSIAWIQNNTSVIFLVISDLRMPSMNGSEVLAKVRSLSEDIQTILLTAYIDIEDIQKAVSSSIMSLLFKPWSKESLIAEIEKAYDHFYLKKENEKLKKEINSLLESAGTFQKVLFSQDIPKSSCLHFDIEFIPHENYHCGGDFYDILDTGNNTIAVILGDVAGHGPRSAMVAAMAKVAIQSTIKNKPEALCNLNSFLSELNDMFCSILSGTPDLLITISIAYINPDKAELSFISAGEPPTIFFTQNKLTLLKSSNHALGVIPNAKFSSLTLPFLKGDSLYLFTDGLIESIETSSLLSNDKICEIFTQFKNKKCQEITNHFKSLQPETKFTDDVTLVSIYSNTKAFEDTSIDQTALLIPLELP